MAERRLPSSEEMRVRTAAIEAGRRMSWDVPRQVLDYIVATSDPRQGPAALEMRAAGIVEYVKNHPDRPDFANATDREVQGFFRMIHGQVVSRFGGLQWALALAREGEASADDSGAGAVSSFMRDDTFMASPAGRAMQRYARLCGLDWAAESPDILRLGRGAIEALRDAHFRRESFNRLRDAGFEGREAARIAVGISRYAIQHGLDANRIAEETARGVEVFGGNSPEARALWRDRFTRFFASPDDAQAREDMTRALNEVETSPSSTPEQRERVQRLRPLLRLEQRARTVQLTAEVQATTAVTANDALMADLNAGPVVSARQRAETEPRPPGSQRTTAAENTVQPSRPSLG